MKRRFRSSAPSAPSVVDLALRWAAAAVLGAAASAGELALVPADAAAGDFLGYGVAISGDTAIVGARGDDDLGGQSGSAYVFLRAASGWVEQQKLTASDGGAGDVFGSAVAIDGDVAVVGAPLGFFQAGAAYVFERVGTAWTEAAILHSPTPGGFHSFGQSVAVDGDTIVVGAPHAGPSMQLGEAFVFRKNGGAWGLEATLLASDGQAGDWFGASVAVSADLAIVGSSKDKDLGFDAGSAYAFARIGATWVEVGKLLASDGASSDRFGAAVALDDTTAAIGAWGDDDLGSGAGAAYVFQPDVAGWAEQAKLLASDGDDGDVLGGSLALEGDTLVVGANIDDGGGSAYVFRGAGASWTEERKLTASDGAPGESYGYSVGVSNDVAIVGANLHEGVGADSGGAYLYENVTASIPYGAACAGGGGIAPSFDVTGDLTNGGTFAVEVSDGPASSQAVVLIGTGQVAIPIGTGGCNLYAFPLISASIGPFGLSPSGAGSVSIPTPSVVAPTAFALQAFVLDAGVADQFTTTNGVSVELRP